MDQQIEHLVEVATAAQQHAKGLQQSAGIYAAMELVTQIMEMAKDDPCQFIGFQIAQPGDIKNGLGIIKSQFQYRNDLRTIKKGRPKANTIDEFFDWIAGYSTKWVSIPERTKYKMWNLIKTGQLETPVFHITTDLFHDEIQRLKEKDAIEKSNLPTALKKIAMETIE